MPRVLNKPLNICYINQDFIPVRGSGQTVYAEKIAHGLAHRHNITVVTTRPPGQPETEFIDGIRVIRLPVPKQDPSQWIAFGYIAARFLKHFTRREHFDIIHFLDCHVGYAATDGFVVSLHQSFNQRLNGRRGLPYHSSVWNLIQRYPYYHFSKHLENIALKKADAGIAISHATRNEFINHYQADPDRIDVVYSGIDTDFFKPVENTGQLRKILGLTTEKVLLYVGFSTPRKGLEDLADALHRLKTRNVKLVVVGKWEKGYRRTFTQRLGHQAERVIEAGYVEDAHLPAFYSLADLFVLPSLLEGFGFPLVEAMACGTPIIASQAGSIPEVVGDCGLTVPPGDSGQLAAAIDRVLANSDMYHRLKKNSRKRACSLFSTATMIQNTEAFYDKHIKSKNRNCA